MGKMRLEVGRSKATVAFWAVVRDLGFILIDLIYILLKNHSWYIKEHDYSRARTATQTTEGRLLPR